MTIFVVVSGGVAEVVEDSIPSYAQLKAMRKNQRVNVEIIDWDNLKANRHATIKRLSKEARRYVRSEERRQQWANRSK